MTLFRYIVFIAMVCVLITGCANPNNNNNFNITVNASNDRQGIEQEIMRNCMPKSKCPHLWRWFNSTRKQTE